MTAIANRMIDYFVRQIALFEDWVTHLPDTSATLDENAWLLMADGAKQYDAKARQLEEEFFLLKREWDAATDLSEQERARVVELAQRAKVLSDGLAAWFGRAEVLAAKERDAIRAQLDTLGRGRTMLEGYRPKHDKGQPGFMDKRA